MFLNITKINAKCVFGTVQKNLTNAISSAVTYYLHF